MAEERREQAPCGCLFVTLSSKTTWCRNCNATYGPCGRCDNRQFMRFLRGWKNNNQNSSSTIRCAEQIQRPTSSIQTVTPNEAHCSAWPSRTQVVPSGCGTEAVGYFLASDTNLSASLLRPLDTKHDAANHVSKFVFVPLEIEWYCRQKKWYYGRKNWYCGLQSYCRLTSSDFRPSILERCLVPVKDFLTSKILDLISLGCRLPTCYLSSLFNIIIHIILALL